MSAFKTVVENVMARQRKLSGFWAIPALFACAVIGARSHPAFPIVHAVDESATSAQKRDGGAAAHKTRPGDQAHLTKRSFAKGIVKPSDEGSLADASRVETD